ncbi:MAG: hypothetical protein KUL76_08560, partial [Kaistella sp.]|nr:hypothetical protein [Kaistella sp.]
SGSIQKFIGLNSLRAIPILFNKETINAYSTLTEVIYLRMNNILLQNQQLAQLRDWLLPMLMNGQVTVGEAEGMVNGLGMVAEERTRYD